MKKLAKVKEAKALNENDGVVIIKSRKKPMHVIINKFLQKEFGKELSRQDAEFFKKHLTDSNVPSEDDLNIERLFGGTRREDIPKIRKVL